MSLETFVRKWKSEPVACAQLCFRGTLETYEYGTRGRFEQRFLLLVIMSS